MALTHLPPGELAVVVTYLEMRARPGVSPLPASPLFLRRRVVADLDWYRALFRRVGAPWLWFSRLAMDDASLTSVIHDPATEVFAAMLDGTEIGLLELDLRTPGACGLAYVALAPEYTGQGLGRQLIAAALDLAWRDGVERVHLRTCTLDHPAALPAYLRAGFAVGGRAVETFADPRVTGLLPPEAAPQVPLVPAGATEPARRR